VKGIVMEMKPTIRVFHEAGAKSVPGIEVRQNVRVLTGNEDRPSERMFVFVKNFEAGTHETLHWHLIEVFYYIISGRGVLKDIAGNSYELGPGTSIYAPPGIAGSHEWDIIEPLQLIGFRATRDGPSMMQFVVDKDTGESTIPFDYLERWGNVQLKRSLY
jgi:mannose-6-phosphate isomerase-like protein (cupin superfamily)